MKHSIILFVLPLFIFVSLRSCSDKNDRKARFIVPEAGYAWPSNSREYWPTESWQTDDFSNHNMDASKLQRAIQFAENDPLTRAVLVVKDGYLVFEDYYHDGTNDLSSNLWSVTKSISSAVVGLTYDDRHFSSTDEFMKELMPHYPEFGSIRLEHVLTHTTGLSWVEEGPLWVEWILSDDWVTSALARKQLYEPGSRWKYSSANTHILSELVKDLTGTSMGNLAKSRLFEPMGISINLMDEPQQYTSWNQYITPVYQGWHQDPNGNECASFGLFLTARDMAKFGYLYLNKGRWENDQLLSEKWVIESTRDKQTNIYGRYSYGYQWYITLVDGHPAFLASGYGGQIIGVVPSLDMVVVLKYEAEYPEHPVSGTEHDDMMLFELVVKSVND